VLVLLLDFADSDQNEILPNAEERWGKLIFGRERSNGNHYWYEVSAGQFQILPAAETQPKARSDRNVNRGSITKAMQEQLERGRTIYAQHCAACHGANGEGAAEGAPALSGQASIDAVMERVRKGGVQMPPMQTMLDEQQIRDVSLFVERGL